MSGIAGVEFLSGWFNPGSSRTTRECMKSLPADIKRVFGNLRLLTNYGIKTTLTVREQERLRQARIKFDEARSLKEKEDAFQELEHLEVEMLGKRWVDDSVKFAIYKTYFPDLPLYCKKPYSCLFASKEVSRLIRQNRVTAQLVQGLNQRCDFPVDLYTTITESLGGLPTQIEMFLLDAPRNRYDNNTDQEPS